MKAIDQLRKNSRDMANAALNSYDHHDDFDRDTIRTCYDRLKDSIAVIELELTEANAKLARVAEWVDSEAKISFEKNRIGYYRAQSHVSIILNESPTEWLEAERNKLASK